MLPIKSVHGTAACAFMALLIACVWLNRCSFPDQLADYKKAAGTKKYDLVLIHGLSGIHQWSDDFLRVCLYNFGSGHVYVIYTDESNEVWERSIDGMTVHLCGKGQAWSAGRDFISRQAELAKIKIDILEKRGLSRSFNMIGHSMGGLVARRYIHDNPGRVVALVTLGTPHHGSPLADSFQWAGVFIGAKDAITDLQPERCEIFNQRYPIDDSVMADGGRVFTIDGGTSRGKSFGVVGELLFGWEVLKTCYGVDNDGLVPQGSGTIAGATHFKHFATYDHYELVREPSVAAAACSLLR
ncbi:MAG: alpha/beta hydrolase [Spirochaetes bacterium]|nr:alpha/beta hydrolase [Spirochaetota bacterium]